jgi:MerR family copper efflux transcriptional regulator
LKGKGKSEDQVLTIGKLAKAAGVTTPTIRYYEEIGLLPTADRTDSGQRVYGASDLERLTFIRRCRDFGFGIEQVRVLAGLSTSADRDCREVGQIARVHLSEVQTKLAELKALERSLQRFVAQCDAVCCGGPGRDCVVFQDLATGAS